VREKTIPHGCHGGRLEEWLFAGSADRRIQF
jgi:hypothetical protein